MTARSRQPTEPQLTIYGAASVLGVPPSHVRHLLNTGDLTSEGKGQAQRLATEAVFQFRASRDQQRSAALDQLALLDAVLV